MALRLEVQSWRRRWAGVPLFVRAGKALAVCATEVRVTFRRPPEPYERLVHEALTGDHSLFTREDSVEETWRVLQPLVDHPPAPLPYLTGSWGPPQADELLRAHPPWQLPWLPVSEMAPAAATVQSRYR